MKITVNARNLDRIQAAINSAQGKATARTISASDVFDALETLETEIGIAKCKLDGTTATIDANAQDFPNSYKYRPMSTIFSVVNHGGKWTLTDVYRGQTHRYNARFYATLSDTAKKALLDSYVTFR